MKKWFNKKSCNDVMSFSEANNLAMLKTIGAIVPNEDQFYAHTLNDVHINDRYVAAYWSNVYGGLPVPDGNHHWQKNPDTFWVHSLAHFMSSGGIQTRYF